MGCRLGVTWTEYRVVLVETVNPRISVSVDRSVGKKLQKEMKESDFKGQVGERQGVSLREGRVCPCRPECWTDWTTRGGGGEVWSLGRVVQLQLSQGPSRPSETRPKEPMST